MDTVARAIVSASRKKPAIIHNTPTNYDIRANASHNGQKSLEHLPLAALWDTALNSAFLLSHYEAAISSKRAALSDRRKRNPD